MVGGIVFAVALLAGGCSQPTQIDRDNRRALDAILTAVTMKNANWLEEDARLVEKRHEAGQFTDWEYEQVLAIIEKARLGDWQAAENLGYQFRKERPFVREGE
jgi:hypothetical protein